jgi:hypothetical protein
MARSNLTRRLRGNSTRGVGFAAWLSLATIFCCANLPRLTAAEDTAPKAPTAPVAAEEDDALQQDRQRLIGRWERTIPNSKPRLREILTIEEDRDTLETINDENAVVSRYTSQFKLERVGDVRIYTRSRVKAELGKSPVRTGATDQSFILQFHRRWFYEVSGLLHGRNGGLQRHVVAIWKKLDADNEFAGDYDPGPDDEAQPDAETPAADSRPAIVDDADLKRDLKLLQGSWVLVTRNAEGDIISTNQKLIEGNTERVIYSDGEGNVMSEHTVEFRLVKYGPIRVFTFFNMTTVLGPGVGDVSPDEFSFVYKVDEDQFLDAPGVFVSRPSYRPIPAITVWRRPQTSAEIDATLAIEELSGEIVRNTTDDGETILIRLNGKRFGDEHLRLLKPFRRLVELTLVDSRVTDAGMKELAQFPNLTRLELRGTAITDAGLKEISRLEKLQTLGLSGTPITDKGVAELAGMPELRQLYLGGTKMTDTGVKTLSRLENLTLLGLNGVRLTDIGLAELAKFKQLKTLNLGGNRVTDALIPQLLKLQNLAELKLANSKITDAGLQQLKAALPQTNVQR